MTAASKTGRVRQGLTSAGISAITLLTVGCFATLSIYAGNSDEFVAPFGKLLLIYAPYLVILCLGAGLLGALMTDQGAQRYIAMLSAVAVLVWLQGNILVWDYGSLDGRGIDWLSADWRGALDLSIWAVVLVVAISAYARFGRVLVIAAVATLLIQLISTFATTLFSPVALRGSDNIDLDSTARDALFDFSKTNNVVHIVMDGFQSDIFAQVIADAPRRNLSGELRGFTFFPEHLGVYPYTQLTVPAFLSGKLHRNEVPVADFVRTTLQGETILNTAVAAGYEVDVAAPIGLANIYGMADVTHSHGITSSDHVSAEDYALNDSAKLIDLALFRVVPHFAKALIYRDQLWVFQGRIRPESYLQLQFFADLTFLRQLAEQMSVGRDTPVYKMIHVMLSHKPTVGDERCGYDGRRRTNRTNVSNQARCGLLAVLDVLQRMRDLGIYDRSLIVLMGDHGAWVPVENIRNSAGLPESVDAMTVAMAMPVLAIKRPNDDADFRVSGALTSVVDIPATIADVLDFESEFNGMSAFEVESNNDRTRVHLKYGYGMNPRARGYLFPMQEYEVQGSPLDAAAWRKGARHIARTAESSQDPP